MSLWRLSLLILYSFASQPHNALTNIERNVTDAAQIIIDTRNNIVICQYSANRSVRATNWPDITKFLPGATSRLAA